MIHSQTRQRSTLFLLAALVPLSMLVSVSLGSSGWQWLTASDPLASRIILELRLPRTLAALMVGSMLAVAGCLMQVLLRNPLADPYILGLSGGASVFALAGMMLGLAWLPVPLMAFAGALATTLIVFYLARGEGAWTTTRVLLTGVIVAAGWSALISLLLATGDDASLRGMLFWLMGDLSHARISSLWLIPLAIGLTLIWLRSRSLNVLSGGAMEAELLGEPSQRRFWEVYLAASLLTGVSVAMAGAIGFVGLIVPHLTRLLIGADHRWLLPAAACFGGSFLVLADTLARTLLSPRQLPVGVLTALIGVPLFLILLRRATGIR
jgi:iron complex transport system permease protein